MPYLNIIYLACACVCVVDLSGIIQSIEAAASKYTGKRCRIPKPFSCSLCMTHWTGLIYLLCSGNLSLPTYAYLLLIAVSTQLIREAILTAQDLILAVIRLLQKLT